jgi:hypothetical protein
MRELSQHTAYRMLLILGCFVSCCRAQPRPVDLSGEPAFAAEPGKPFLIQRHINMLFVSSDRLVLASDLYGRCDDNKKDNGYAILVLNVSTGAVVARRTIPAAPNSYTWL